MTIAPEPTIVERPWPFEVCPDCNHGHFTVDSPGAEVVFTCRRCGTGWRYMLGYLHQVA